MKSKLLNIALFFAAPFIGLLYAMLLPFVGMGMMLMLSLKSKKTEQVTGLNFAQAE